MLTWPVSLLVTTRSSRPSAGGIDRLDVGDAQADGEGQRRQESRGIEAGLTELPSWLLKKTESVPSPALRTTRSSKPLPLRSAAMICAGSWPVASEPTRTKPPSR